MNPESLTIAYAIKPIQLYVSTEDTIRKVMQTPVLYHC